MLVGEQDHDMGVAAGACDPHLEAFGHPIDERLAVEPAPMIASLLDPSQLFLAEDHRPAGRANPPVKEGLLQAALLCAEVAPPRVPIAFIDPSNSLSQMRHGAASR